MQNAKDTFYVELRDRLGVLNPARTVLVRQALRPAVVVQENEMEGAMPDDAFALIWKAVTVDSTEPLPLRSAVCEVHYATRGTQERTGMDRGRALDAMDRELRAVLEPRSAQKRRFDVDPAVGMATSIFWSEAESGVAAMDGDRAMRVATVTLFALREEGE